MSFIFFHRYPFLLFFIILLSLPISFFFFFNDTATTEIYTLSLHDALPILLARRTRGQSIGRCPLRRRVWKLAAVGSGHPHQPAARAGASSRWFCFLDVDGELRRHLRHVQRDRLRQLLAADFEWVPALDPRAAVVSCVSDRVGRSEGDLPLRHQDWSFFAAGAREVRGCADGRLH